MLSRNDEGRQIGEKEKIILPNDPYVKTLATFIPDEIIYSVNDYSRRHYEACVMFGDVFGFTDLAEGYSLKGATGPSQMTQELNKYLGAMVQEVMSHNGDVIKFSGDAFLAMWKITQSETMRDIVHQAIDCALVIQKKYGNCHTAIGIVIKVKLVISAGHVTFALIGTEEKSHWYLVGKPIWEVKKAELDMKAGEILVSAAAWHFTKTDEYISESKNGMYKISGLWVRKRTVSKSQIPVQYTHEQFKDSSSSEDSDVDTNSVLIEINRTEGDGFALRPALETAVNLNINDLRKFITAPVLTSIDQQDLEYLTETRQIVVVFIDVVYLSMEDEQLITLADEIYQIVCRIAHKKHGCVNKTSIFDKDLMFLVLFGLRGFKHVSENRFALMCALQCQKVIDAMPAVKSCSIGVTAGKSYCGVFGHTLRREYTAISLVVNKAARMMMSYKNKVTCDRETFVHSKMEPDNFVLLESKYLKGISSPGPIYEFIGKGPKMAKMNSLPTVSYMPLLGRNNKIKLFCEHLVLFLKGVNLKNVLILKGEPKLGKTRLIKEMIYITPHGISIAFITLTEESIKIPYEALRLILFNILKLPANPTKQEIKSKLQNIFADLQNPETLYFLNPIFGVDFPTFPNVDQYQTDQIVEKLLTILGDTISRKKWLIVVDDCHFIDSNTWELLSRFIQYKKLFFVLAIGTHIVWSEKSNAIFSHENTIISILRAIDRRYQGGLACQFMEVFAIPPTLEKIIQTKSNGNPGWIENYLISLLQAGELTITTANMKDIEKLHLWSPPLYMIYRMTEEQVKEWKNKMEEKDPDLGNTSNWKFYVDICRDQSYAALRSQLLEKIHSESTVPVCHISACGDITNVSMENTIDVSILSTFDFLTSYEKFLVKCASVLGFQFSRQMLVYVMDTMDDRHFALALQKMFEISIFTCAEHDLHHPKSQSVLSQNNEDNISYFCYCCNSNIKDDCQDLPPYAFCLNMQFKSNFFRKTTYSLLTEQQQTQFHNRAIKYLKRLTRKCDSCGGGFFLCLLDRREIEEYQDSQKFIDKRGCFKLLFTSCCGQSNNDSSVYAEVSLNQNKESENKSFPVLRSFSDKDFSQCKCITILERVYSQLVDHAEGAGEWRAFIKVSLKYASLNLVQHNTISAFQTLNKTLEVINNFREKDNWVWNYYESKVNCLLGAAHSSLKQLDQAERYLLKSLSNLGYNFNFQFNQKYLFRYYNYNLLIRLIRSLLANNLMSRHMSFWQTKYYIALAETLSYLTEIFLIRKKFKKAEFASVWGLLRALEAGSCFVQCCLSLKNMLQVAFIFNRLRFCSILEKFALRFCASRDVACIEDLKAITSVYEMVFNLILWTHDLTTCVELGNITNNISIACQMQETNLYRMTSLILCALICFQIDKISHLFVEFDIAAEKARDDSGRLWNLRNKNFGAADLWYVNIEEQKWNHNFKISRVDKVTAVYFLEGLLLLLVQRIDCRDIQDCIDLQSHIERLICKMENHSGLLLAPRIYHLKAYYSIIRDNKKKAFAFLKKGSRIAMKNNNLLALEHIRHSKKVWKKKQDEDKINFWTNHAIGDQQISYTEMTAETVGCYTYPIPKYY